MLSHAIASHNRRGTPIYLRGTCKPIGIVHGDTFTKSIDGSKHMLRQPKAIAFDVSTLDDAESIGATNAAITDRDTGLTYYASIADIRRYGFSVMRGHGRQIALPIDRWSIDGEPPAAERQAAQSNKERNNLQLGLFGGVA